jgi:predicted ATPase
VRTDLGRAPRLSGVRRPDYGARVARTRDARRFGRGPYLLGLRRDAEQWGEGFPFDVPAVEAIERLELDASITLLAGENGSGKSTIVEALAAAIGFAEGGGELERLGELPAVTRPVLGGALVPQLTEHKPRNGYFLRAESFFNVAAFVDGGTTFAPDVSLYGGRALHEQSHGQSFLALAANRFGGESLYILDEPEAALSITGELALLAIMVRAAGNGSQLVVATHSPVLLACPGARIYELDATGIEERAYDDLEAVSLTRAFLEAPERFLRAALAEEG